MIRLFRCQCQAFCIRPIEGDPEPCDVCHSRIDQFPYVVDRIENVGNRIERYAPKYVPPDELCSPQDSQNP